MVQHVEEIKTMGMECSAKIKGVCLYTGFLVIGLLFCCGNLYGQNPASKVAWIRPHDAKSQSIWGIQDGIVIGLWPSPIESKEEGGSGGPRGLIRMGYEFKGKIYHINYIAIEPVVDGEMEFSEISPSRVDGKWGKLMWASNEVGLDKFFPAARTRGIITHPDKNNPKVEELSFYVHIEQFVNGAHPYLKVSIRSDRPEEVCFEIFDHKDSSPMDRCVLTATMGNYARLRKLYLNEGIVDSRSLYKGFNDIDFIEKEAYPYENIPKDTNGDFIAIMETDETFTELSAWPQRPEYFARWNWRYRPFFKVVQYWRKESGLFDKSLRVRVNGRASYWAGGSKDKSNYVEIPGGPAFENFELREDYYPGQKFYFGMTRKPVDEILNNLK